MTPAGVCRTRSKQKHKASRRVFRNSPSPLFHDGNVIQHPSPGGGERVPVLRLLFHAAFQSRPFLRYTQGKERLQQRAARLLPIPASAHYLLSQTLIFNLVVMHITLRNKYIFL